MLVKFISHRDTGAKKLTWGSQIEKNWSKGRNWSTGTWMLHKNWCKTNSLTFKGFKPPCSAKREMPLFQSQRVADFWLRVTENIHVLCTLFHGKLSFVNDMTGSLYLFSIVGIQIMFNEERNHWIATHYQNGNVKVYDFCFSGSLSPSIRDTLVHLYRPLSTCCPGRNNSLVVTVMHLGCLVT